ncbi:MAG: hypothetical protein COA78_07810 [Blastopirellula sp.]|nr:MAG: hypothetical protein COA78_07810 [Blastopirellula sp.]
MFFVKYKEYPRFEKGEVIQLYHGLLTSEKKIIDNFVRYVSITSKSKTRLENNRRSLTHFRIITGIPFDDVTLENLRHYLALLNFSYMTSASRNDLKASIKRFLRWRYDNWSSRFDELRDLRLDTRRNEGKINASSIIKKNEVEVIVRAESRLNWKTFFLCLFETGFRPKEVRTLRWGDISFNVRGNVSRISIVATKTSRARSAFVQGATQFLEEHRKMQRYSPNDLVFPALRDPSSPVGKDVVSKWLKGLTLKALGRSVTPYIVRHSRATELYLDPKVPDKIAQKILGHSSSMSDVYTHMSDEDVLDVCCDTIYQFDNLPAEKKNAYEERIRKLEQEAQDTHEELVNIKEMVTRIQQLAKKGLLYS